MRSWRRDMVLPASAIEPQTTGAAGSNFLCLLIDQLDAANPLGNRFVIAMLDTLVGVMCTIEVTYQQNSLEILHVSTR